MIISLAIINGIILTGTRMGLITLFVCLVFSLLHVIRSNFLIKKNITQLLFLISVTIARIKLIANTAVVRFQVNENLIQLGGKAPKWSEGTDYASKAPFFGKGVINYFDMSNTALPENIFVETFVITGIIGLILLAILILFFTKNNLIEYINYKKLDNILILICLFGAIISLNIIYLKAFWFVLAICNAGNKSNYKSDEISIVN